MHFSCLCHGHCFDGLASSVLLRVLARGLHPSLEFRVRALGYAHAQTKPHEGLLDGNENAIVDYRYFASPSLTYYFDHHKTAFHSPLDRATFEKSAHAQPNRFAYDPEASSCTLLMSRILERAYQLNLEPYQDLITWADRIDAARFPTAAAACSPDDPILRFASVVEHFGDDEHISRWSQQIAEEGLARAASADDVLDLHRHLEPGQKEYISLVRTSSQKIGPVTLVDLSRRKLEVTAKFAVYAEYPETQYSVVLSLLTSGIRISVGHNPWSGKPLCHDIGAICERFGGGGHPMVGGIALPATEIARGREIAQEMARTLAGDV